MLTKIRQAGVVFLAMSLIGCATIRPNYGRVPIVGSAYGLVKASSIDVFESDEIKGYSWPTPSMVRQVYRAPVVASPKYKLMLSIKDCKLDRGIFDHPSWLLSILTVTLYPLRQEFYCTNEVVLSDLDGNLVSRAVSKEEYRVIYGWGSALVPSRRGLDGFPALLDKVGDATSKK